MEESSPTLKDCVVLYRIIDIITARNLEAVGRLVIVAVLLGWLVMAH